MITRFAALKTGAAVLLSAPIIRSSTHAADKPI